MNSTWSSPNPILYGNGTSAEVGNRLKQFGCKKVLVVFDKGTQAAGVVGKVLGYIRDAGIAIVEYDGVLSDSPDYTINEAGALALREQVDGVVAVGGGSTMDTGKGVTILISNPAPISLYFARPGKPPAGDLSNLKPLIVLPTTSGTGSEVTPGGAVADTENHTKENFVCPVRLGIVDPELTLKLPPQVTAVTAFDAMCHAVEAVVSNQPNPFSQLFGLEALRLIGENLPLVMDDPENLSARGGLLLAATMASMSILGPYCNIPHDIGAVVCIDHNVPHGIAVSGALPEIFEFYAPAAPEEVRLIAEALGGSVPVGAAAAEIGRVARDTAVALMKKARLPQLYDRVPSREALLGSVPKIMATQDFFFSPRPVTAEDVTALLAAAYDRAEREVAIHA